MSKFEEISLDNVIIGDSFRLFYGNNETYYSEKNVHSNDRSFILNVLNEDDLKYNHFMKDNTGTRLNYSYDDDFIKSLEQNLNDNQNQNSVYYNKEFEGLTTKNLNGITQYKSNYYFIGNDVYGNSNNLINGRYELDPHVNYLNVKDILSGYISNVYDKSFYKNSLTYINDKSIPIYDLSKDALSLISILKFKDQSLIYEIIDKFNLSSIKDEILYDSNSSTFSSGVYDSLFIPSIVNFIINESLNEDEINQKLNNLFNLIFSSLSIESFYRLLIPIGKIMTVSNDVDYNKTALSKSQNVYYVNVNNIESLSNNIKFNYFTLKNLKNPHNEHDYEIFNINEDVSCVSNAYDFYDSNQYNILSYLDILNKDIIKMIDDSHAGILSGTYIEENNLLQTLINQSLEKYNNWSEQVIIKGINEERSWLRYKAFSNYFNIIYDKNLKSEPYIITSGEILDFIDEKRIDFAKNYKSEFLNRDELKDLYLSGSNIIDEFYDSLSTIFTGESSQYMRSEKDIFISSIQANTIKSSNLSVTFSNLLKNFKTSLFKPLAKSILNKNDINDLTSLISYNWYEEKYPTRFSAKINDYYHSYDDMFAHENIMKKDGNIFGFRQYNFINSSINDSIYLTYNYFTSYDKEFLNDIDLLNDIEIIKDNDRSLIGWRIEQDSVNDIKLDENLRNLKQFKINETTLIHLKNDDKLNEFIAYYAMLSNIRKFEFVELLEGFNKYKEKDVSKSNVYSIELVNSNLNYECYNFSQMISICLADNDVLSIYDDFDYDKNEFLNSRTGKRIKFIDAIHKLDFHEILDVTLNKDMDILNKINFEIPYSSYKFYKDESINPLNKDIETKMRMRKEVEQAIRKSIHRYAPVNTTLWKIEYSGI